MTFKELRNGTGKRQIDLARELNIKQATISQYEKGIREPKISELPKIAKALGVDEATVMYSILRSKTNGI